MDELGALGARVLAVSPDEAERLQKFAQANEIAFPLLIDADGAVIERYGIRNERHQKGVLPDPTALVLDRSGRVRYKRIDVDYTERPPVGELIEALRSLGE